MFPQVKIVSNESGDGGIVG